MIKRALISVSDKTGIVELAKELQNRGVEIVSTGGTAKALSDAGVKVINISDITGFPECLDGRVKTLHPKVHGGLLAMRSNEEHMKQIRELGIEPIDMVVINLYPFKQTILKEDVKLEEAIENIDIGGPTMLRAAAKNYQDVAVIVDPKDYSLVLEEIGSKGDISPETKFRLAYKVFEHTSHYDTLIAKYLRDRLGEDAFPETLSLTFEKVQEMRYGENPHQKAVFYKEVGKNEGCLTSAEQLHGKELSYNII
jgi:phosphoribosylaminoimidazolecarboxamide formyltransferase/IMP cyclohydrolase